MINISDEAKKAFLTDGVKKEVFIEFPNNDHATITNSSIIKESLSFTESICSRDEFKFGLAEASTLEFDYIGDNIKGKTITCKLRANSVYDISLGTFVVKTCDRGSEDFSKRHVTAYTIYESSIVIFHNLFPFDYRKSEMCQEYSDLFGFYTDVSRYLPFINSNYREETMHFVNPSSTTNSYNIYYIRSSEDRVRPYSECVISVPYALSSQNNIFDSTSEEVNNYFYSLSVPELLKENVKKAKYDFFEERLEDVVGGGETIFEYLTKVLGNNTHFSNDDATEILKNVVYAMHNDLYFCVEYQVYRDTKKAWLWQLIHAYTEEIDTVFPNLLNLNPDFYSFDAHLLLPCKIDITIKNYETDSKKDKDIFNWSYDLYTYETDTTYDFKKIIYNDSPLYVYDTAFGDLSNSDYIEAISEISAMFGHFLRDGSFEYKKLSNYIGRYPSENLYPSNNIYPRDPNGGVLYKNTYISAVYDDIYKKFDRVSITYRNENGDDVETYIQLVDDVKNKPDVIPDGSITIYIENYKKENYVTYSLSYNSIIQSSTFDENGIKIFLKTLGVELQKIEYMPAEIEMQGMPWLETGDAIGIETKDGGIVTYILRRTLSGIWFLKDNIESR